ncbi:MAG: hypothetical protein C4K58_05590 [Flavobacteriaceae bacterium]|nr:MAG: hypothetical protein C4K58_05590 [Flavobacteriaceae bacterium]
MKKVLFALLFSVSIVNAQTNNPTEPVKVGDVVEIAPVSSYKHIAVPQKNFIIKQGGIANYNSLAGKKVVVTKLEQRKDGSTVAIIQPQDGSQFFGSHRTMSVNLNEAIKAGEIL